MGLSPTMGRSNNNSTNSHPVVEEANPKTKSFQFHDDELVCSICLGEFADPVMIRSCGHSFCLECIVHWLQGTPLKRCPICKQFVRKEPDDFDNADNEMRIIYDSLFPNYMIMFTQNKRNQTLPGDFINAKWKLNLKTHLQELNEIRLKSKRLLSEIAVELENVSKNTNTAQIFGNSSAIIGGIASIVGFGLSFIIPPVGLPLGIAGAGFAACGGLTSGGAGMVKLVKERLEEGNLKLHVQKEAEQIVKFHSMLMKFIESLDNVKMTTAWRNFQLASAYGDDNLEDVYPLLGNGLRFVVSIGDAVTRGILMSSRFAIRPAVSVLRAGAHVAGAAVSVALLPVDIILLVNSVQTLKKGSPSKVAQLIRDYVDKYEAVDVDELLSDLDGLLITMYNFANMTSYPVHFYERANDTCLKVL